MTQKLARLHKHRTHIRWMFATIASIAALSISTAQAYAINQNGLHTWGIHYYDIKPPCSVEDGTGPSSRGSSSVSDLVKYLPQVPPGTKTEDQIWYFLTTEVSLSPEAAAGIMGNMQAESHFDPTAEQVPGAWEDMSDASGRGVGLVQWDLGRRPLYIDYAQKHNADKKNIVPQLNFVWNELNSSYKDALTALEAAKSPEDAAFAFHKYYEKSADGPEKIVKRTQYARTVYNTYFSKTITGTAGSGTTLTNCGGDVNTSVGADCGNAQGNARIICAAKMYDTASYSLGAGHNGAGNWHKDCNLTYHYLGTPPATTLNGDAVGPKCDIDCSSLVDLAIFDVFHVDLNEDTTTERAHIGTNWKVVSFTELKPGDIIQPHYKGEGHVEVVDHVQGNTIYTFGAHSSHYPQPRQVSPSSYTQGSGQMYLRYIGTGGEG